MNLSNEKSAFTKDDLISACKMVEDKLKIINMAIEDSSFSEVDVLKILKNTTLGLLIAQYAIVIEKYPELKFSSTYQYDIDGIGKINKDIIEYDIHGKSKLK